ncbi:Esterase FE4 [Frankliniella fusca]|uniref:Esterase FE4 n=1 Tax=Frankliniella fusca TaxID=407009 RepID=A0AAE1HCQ3_9NEOP|nr:Esterase FE4 [Frankliniella fusca]
MKILFYSQITIILTKQEISNLALECSCPHAYTAVLRDSQYRDALPLFSAIKHSIAPAATINTINAYLRFYGRILIDRFRLGRRSRTTERLQSAKMPHAPHAPHTIRVQAGRLATGALLLLVWSALLTRAVSQEVTVTSGRLRGERVQGGGGARDYWAFRGVPYAAPPVGELRYKAPRPAANWSGVRDATVEGNKCPQIKYDNNIGAEDCLNVNVYTPSLECPAGGYAVIVFFHGGSLIEESNSWKPVFGPDFLVHYDVVLMMPNYRLGALGFLNLNTAAIPGNAALKDAVLALRWVHDNARAFCGDPERVTIMGQSAGSKMAGFVALTESARGQCQVVSPLDNRCAVKLILARPGHEHRISGLFRASIQLSGAANSPMAYTELNVERATALARMLGSASDEPAEVERVLLTSPYDLIVNKSYEMNNNPGWGLSYNPFVFSPELRPEDGEPRALTRDPESLLRDPPVPRVPTLTSVCRREALAGAVYLVNNPEKRSLLVKNQVNFFRAEFAYVGKDTARELGVATTPSDSLVKEIASRIQQKFLQGQDPTDDYPEMFANILSDMKYVYPMYRWVHALDNQKAPLYLYLFDFVGEYNYWRSGVNTNVTGAVHADDLGYLFRVTATELHQNISGETRSDRALRAHVKLITDFAKSLTSLPFLGPEHDVALEDRRRRRPPYLHIGDDFRMTRVENTLGVEDRMMFWGQVMELMQSGGATPTRGLGLGVLVAVLLAVLVPRACL